MPSRRSRTSTPDFRLRRLDQSRRVRWAKRGMLPPPILRVEDQDALVGAEVYLPPHLRRLLAKYKPRKTLKLGTKVAATWAELMAEPAEPWSPKVRPKRKVSRSKLPPAQRRAQVAMREIYAGKVEWIRAQRVRSTDPAEIAKLAELLQALKTLRRSLNRSWPSLADLKRLRRFSVSTASRSQAKLPLKRRRRSRPR